MIPLRLALRGAFTAALLSAMACTTLLGDDFEVGGPTDAGSDGAAAQSSGGANTGGSSGATTGGSSGATTGGSGGATTGGNGGASTGGSSGAGTGGGLGDGGTVCPGASFRCSEDGSLEQCLVDGSGWSLESQCTSAAHCNAGDGRCEAAPCEAGELSCNNGVLERCNDTRTGWIVEQTCATPALCDEVGFRCIDPLCAPGEYQCVDGELQACNADRTGFSPGPDCGSEELCDDLNGECDICVAGTWSCNGADLHHCSADGQSNPLEQTCDGAIFCDEVAGLCDTCPADGRGPRMVRTPGGCIDSTEVTNEQYQRFVTSNPPLTGQHPRCSWNNDFEPGVPPTVGREQYPVVGVDWCDAYAFCAWAGRRLCGRIGGGPNLPADFADATKSQWYEACISGSQDLRFPYGDAYQANSCNYSGTQIVPVGYTSTCHAPAAPYSGIFDLSGNADEWEDSCDLVGGQSANGSSDTCRVRGGSYEDGDLTNPQVFLECAADWFWTRNLRRETVGFRCCAP
jgi:hypothetical protein